MAKKQFQRTNSQERISAIAEHLRIEEPRGVAAGQTVLNVSLDQIQPNPFQPRRSFSESALVELAESIKSNGLLQPLTARKEDSGNLTLIAGHRRWQAVVRLGLDTVPVVIRENTTDDDLRTLALVENLQREDLHVVDKVIALFEFSQQHKTVAAAAQILGMNRSALANWTTLIDLGEPVLNLCREIPELSLRRLQHLLKMSPPRRLAEVKKWVAQVREPQQKEPKPLQKAPVKNNMVHQYLCPERKVSITISLKANHRKATVTVEDYRAALLDALARLDECAKTSTR
ncbi:MAG: ParB/RepB/Spo0J family partition protein [Blastocatellia bacterium]|nr:ParB/RepB/Spo0J family partition protein [Blastocatellia bacterium]